MAQMKHYGIPYVPKANIANEASELNKAVSDGLVSFIESLCVQC